MDEQQSFPYLQILSVVLMSVLVTAILFWVWHLVEMNTLKGAHTKLNNGVRSEIATLEAHVSTLGTSTTVKK